MAARKLGPVQLAVRIVGGLTLIVVASFPVYYMLLTSLKPPALLLAQPPRFLFTPVLDNYVTLLRGGEFELYYRNSLMVALASTAIGVLLGSMVAFALERGRLRGEHFWMFIILLPRSFPPVATIIPIFFAARSLGLLDQVITLVIFEAAVRLPLVIWVMRGFLRAVPDELIDAAMLDGCSLSSAFFRIVFPIVLPGLAAVSVISFIDTWNAFLVPLVLTNLHGMTAPVGLMSYMETDEQLLWGVIAAGGILTITPLIVVAVALRRFLLQGLTAGAIK